MGRRPANLVTCIHALFCRAYKLSGSSGRWSYNEVELLLAGAGGASVRVQQVAAASAAGLPPAREGSDQQVSSRWWDAECICHLHKDKCPDLTCLN